MIAFFIDADNLNSSEWIDEAFTSLEAHSGTIAVRRAYGSADNMKSLAQVMLDWAIRPFVNLSLTKNTTDVALAVDVMELACQATKPSLIAIGSGDADFVPLVVRLRERGIRMICVSERGKMASEAVHAYDDVVYVGKEQQKPATKTSADHTAKKAPTKKVAAKKVVTVVQPVQAASKEGAVKKVPAAAKTKANKDVSIEQILAAVPSLRMGELQSLGKVVEQLHTEKLIGKNATSTKLFKKFPEHFELTPAKQPNQVRYVPG